MMEEKTKEPDDTDKVIKKFRDAYRKFVDYLRYVETIPEAKRTMKQKELVAK